MTAEELLAIQNYSRHGHSGQRATGIALAAGAVGIGLIGLPLVAWLGKAHADKAAAMAIGNQRDIDRLAQYQLAEQERQHSINLAGTKTIVDVAQGGATAGATAGASSASSASVDALLAILSGSRSGQVCPQPVALYTPAQPYNPCGCPCN